MTMIERAARAIYDAEDSQSGDTIGTVIWNSEHLFCDNIEGEEIVDRAWRACRPVCLDAVRAVLQALREPSEGMVDKCFDVGGWDYDFRVVWQAGIDAALSE